MRRPVPAEPLPSFISPMLLEQGAPPSPTPDAWAVEVKFDGIRAQLRIDGTRGWCVRSRPGRDCSDEFPELRGVAAALARHQVVLDGELVHLGADGRPDFAALRRRLTPRASRRAAGSQPPATLVVFDALHMNGWAV